MTHLGLDLGRGERRPRFRTVGFDADAARVRGIACGRAAGRRAGCPRRLAARRAHSLFQPTPAISAVRRRLHRGRRADRRSRPERSLRHPVVDRQVSAQRCRRPRYSSCCVRCRRASPAVSLSPARLYYQVETLVFGRAVERAMQPERISSAVPIRPSRCPKHYAGFLGAFGCPILPMRYESAELAKIAINCCLVASITVANTLAELRERIGADWSEIVPALKLDAASGSMPISRPASGLPAAIWSAISRPCCAVGGNRQPKRA